MLTKVFEGVCKNFLQMYHVLDVDSNRSSEEHLTRETIRVGMFLTNLKKEIVKSYFCFAFSSNKRLTYICMYQLLVNSLDICFFRHCTSSLCPRGTISRYCVYLIASALISPHSVSSDEQKKKRSERKCDRWKYALESPVVCKLLYSQR